MWRKPHILGSKIITEAYNPKSQWSSQFPRECCVLHSMLRNLVSLFIKVFSLYNPISFFVILYPKSLVNRVVEVGTRHSHQILLYTNSSSMEIIRNLMQRILYQATTKFCGPSRQVVFHDRENKHDFVKNMPCKRWNLCVCTKTSLVSFYYTSSIALKLALNVNDISTFFSQAVENTSRGKLDYTVKKFRKALAEGGEVEEEVRIFLSFPETESHTNHTLDHVSIKTRAVRDCLIFPYDKISECLKLLVTCA